LFSGWSADQAGKAARHVLVFVGDQLWYAGSPNQRGIAAPARDSAPVNSRFVFELPQLPKEAADKSTEVRLFALTEDGRALELRYPANYPFASTARKGVRPSPPAAEKTDGVTFYLHDGAQVKAGVPGRRLYDVKTELVDFTFNRVKVKVELPEPAFMVYLDNYDRHWSAKVNGERAHISRANFTFKTVYLPAGSSVVEWTYNPYRLKIAWALYYAVLLAFVLLCLLSLKSQPRPAAA
jgi:hypothetical protein